MSYRNPDSRLSSVTHGATVPSPWIEPESDEEESYVDYFYDEPGALPGTLIIEENAPHPVIVLIDYSETKATRVQIEQPEECVPYLDSESVSWVDV
ncbi:MAG: hypothetical protein SFW36_04630, partial [Leptolyngbyaceae cyanobacterium bins.59]|nr:hypothetical protein [Leptolyngbyaceae cyanobacterium bins.59]